MTEQAAGGKRADGSTHGRSLIGIAFRVGHTTRMWMLFIAILIVGFALNELLRHRLPTTYKVVEVTSWTIEGLLWLAAIAGGIYFLASGKLF